MIEAAKERGLQVHGVLYDLETGLLEDLQCSEDAQVEKKRLATFDIQ